MAEDIWSKLYKEARRVQKNRRISPFIEAGGVAAALLTKSGTIYVGVCIDTASTLGMCAERNAIANMITNGEHQIEKNGCRDRGWHGGFTVWCLQGIYDAT